MIQPNKGKKPVDSSPAATAHLHAATFKGGPPTEGCWCDLPPIGKRPLSPPSNAYNFVTAAQAMAIEVREGQALHYRTKSHSQYVCAVHQQHHAEQC